MPYQKTKTGGKQITKRFKIGEYSKGGILKLTIDQTESSSAALTHTLILIECQDWTTKETLSDAAINILNPKWKQEVADILLDLTTSYYTDKCMDWIQLQLDIEETARLEKRIPGQKRRGQGEEVGLTIPPLRIVHRSYSTKVS